MNYKVMYRSENSKKLQQRLNKGKYIVIETKMQSQDKNKCIEYAREMNNHVKEFHKEQFGKNIYFVRGVK